MADVVQKTEKAMEKAAEELSINLPKVDIPFELKLIALFTMIGGLSIIGSSFADVFSREQFSFTFYSLRLISGMVAIVVAYGIVRRKQWSVLLYTILVGLGFIFNPLLAIFPAIVVGFLYYHWHDFRPKTLNIHEENLGKLEDFVKKVYKSYKKEKKIETKTNDEQT